ncbi:MAG: peptidoglycan DD-metalloendopeptidase family protein [Rhodospirillales bacterium]|nr:peptidoglycan DD-metalloendopeptidase family protein [Rhodospirillales bacterium]
MRHAPRSSLRAPIRVLGAALIVAGAATGTGAEAAPPSSKEAATREEMQAAEKAKAAQLAAQKQAAAQAAAARAEEQRLTADRIAAMAKLRDAEAATSAAAARMEDLAAKQREADRRLAARVVALEPLLPLIERLALYPTETLLAVPLPPDQAVRGLIVLQGMSHGLAEEMAALRRDQAAWKAATQAVQAEAPKLAAAQRAQAEQAAALDRQIAEAQAQRRAADADADAAAERAAKEAARADSLRGALATLEAERKAAEAKARQEAIRAERQRKEAEAEAARQREAALSRSAGSMASAGSAATPRGRALLTAPVAGSIVRAWGDSTEAGPATGISYQAAPSARVVAPCSGRVAFADPFRSYGQLLILDCCGGYHAVLAGFERLDVKVGQSVQSGEPVGVMPTWDPAGTGRRPLLYVELRRGGQPVNPAPWLKSSS